MKKHLVLGLLAFLVSAAAFGNEAKLQSFLDSGSWQEGARYCDKDLLEGLSRRKDIGNVSAMVLSRLATFCAALAGRAGDDFKSGWWWYTAVSLDLKAAQELLPRMREKGLLASLPEPRSVLPKAPEKLEKGQVRLASGEVVAGTGPRAVTKPKIPKVMFLPVSNVARAEVAVEMIVSRDGLPRQPLLVEAKALPAHVFFAYHFVSGFRFEPARVNGEPVECAYTMTVTTQKM